MTRHPIPDSTGIVPALHALMERLADPDLTAAEAEDLRPRLIGLLDAVEGVRAVRHAAAVGRGASREPERCLAV